MELRAGTGRKDYKFKKLNTRKSNNSYDDFMRCTNPSVSTSLICCCADPTVCGNLVFKFYSIKKKKPLMVRDLYTETVEYGPDLSLEEAVFVGYATDWLSNPKYSREIKWSTDSSSSFHNYGEW